MRIPELVVSRQGSCADQAWSVGASNTNAWRGVNPELARWIDSFVKVHEFLHSDSAIPAGAPLPRQCADENAILCRRHARAKLLPDIADMLEKNLA